MNDADLVIVLTTMPDDTRADDLAAALVEARLAACVNVQAPMRSVYRWKGKVERDVERQLVIKTGRAQLPHLEALVRERHPYEVPEWLVLDAAASAAYEEWVRNTGA